MTGKTITRADLCEAVYQTVGLSRTESANLVELVLDEICGSIVRGESVKPLRSEWQNTVHISRLVFLPVKKKP